MKTKKESNSDSASKFRLLSFNPNSVGKNPKRQKVFNALRKKNLDILLLADTRISKEVENIVKTDWGGKSYFSSFSSQARGCAILFRKEFPAEIDENSVFADKSGNFLCLNFKYENFTITVSCIYGPNEDDPDFFRNVLNRTELLQNGSDFTILGGDWNLVLDQSLDTFGYKAEHNKAAKIVLKEGMENMGWVDIFREFNPQKKRFSWRKFKDTKRARLDFHLISAQLLPFVQKSDIIPGIDSDHSIVELEIDFSKFKRGTGFFKYNNSLNKDFEYVEKVKETIKNVVQQYAEDCYNPDFFQIATPEQLQETTSTLNPQLFLETLMMEIRGTTIQYCATKKKIKNAAKNLALHRLEVAEEASDSQPNCRELLEKLNEAKKDVEIFEKTEAEGALVRARALWQIEGEKPSKFFCNLEKFNALQKYIPKLKVKNEKNVEIEVTEQQKIDKEIRKFYASLYKSRENLQTPYTIDSFLGKNANKCPKIQPSEALKLEGLIALEEATNYIKKCRADASPGSSGFTGGFFKLFWRDIKCFVVNALNYAYEIGNLYFAT